MQKLPFTLQTFAKLKKQTESDYKQIKKLHSPALKTEIFFSSDGFHHLCYDNSRKERSKKVQRNKLIFFKKAVNILEISSTIQEYRQSICPVGKPNKQGFRKTKLVEWFGFFAITDINKKLRLKVIIKRIGGNNGQYHFWSIIPYWKLSRGGHIIGAKEIEDQ